MAESLKVYLDNCVFNRPFDNQDKLSVRLETEAKLFIQRNIKENRLQLIWSYILDYENHLNPFVERKEAIGLWKKYAIFDIEESDELLKHAEGIIERGIKSKDALHIASAIIGEANYFITTDKEILRKISSLGNLICCSPVNLIDVLED